MMCFSENVLRPSFLLLLAILGEQTVLCASSVETEILDRLLNRTVYDYRVRPPGLDKNASLPHGGPVNVTINMMIRSISKIDDVNMEFSTQLTFREEWSDPRLAYGEGIKKKQLEEFAADGLPLFLVLSTGQTIWMPDTFFQNEKQARRHNIDKPNVMIRIHSDGKILYSVRLSLVLSCPMNLKQYPMDVQLCKIQMGSYAYTTTDINYLWKAQNPIQIKDGVKTSLPSFKLTKHEVRDCASVTNTGTYGCLECRLTLRRQFSYYLLQVYGPTAMLVIVSWVSFWLDRTAVPARVTLGVTSLLTMTTQASGINAKLPPVSYTKAIDIWIGACLTFIFGALLEFAYVTYNGTRDFQRKAKLKANTPPPPPPPPSKPTSSSDNERGYETKRNEELRESRRSLLGRSKKKRPASEALPRYGYFYPRLDDPTPGSISSHRLPPPPNSLSIGDGVDIWLPQPPPPQSDDGSTAATAATATVGGPHVCCLMEADANSNMVNQTAMLLNDRRSYENALDAPRLQHLYQQQPVIPVQAVLLPVDHFDRRRSHRRRHWASNCSLVVWIRAYWQKVKRDMDDDKSKKIDWFSRLLFPLSFLIFNIIYWSAFTGYQVIEQP